MHERSDKPILREQDGQTMVEYALVLAVVVFGVMSAFLLFSGATAALWDRIATAVGAVIP